MDEQPCTQLTDIESLVGKTVDRVERYGGIVLVFADRTFAWIQLEYGYEACDTTIGVEQEMDDGDRVECRLATAKEVEEYREEQERLDREREAAQVTKRRREYERLKAEFEDKP